MDDGASHMKLKHLEALLDGEGSVTLGAVDGVGCATIAMDGRNNVAVLVRGCGESIAKLLSRLNEAIRVAVEDGGCVDEING